jgi:hypothetical protein
MTSRGALVRYEMPALPTAFPQLSRILDGSAHQARAMRSSSGRAGFANSSIGSSGITARPENPCTGPSSLPSE